MSAQAEGPSGGFGATAAGVGVFFEASVPNLPGTEYTVMLDHGTDSPDPYLDPRQHRTPIIVVQNGYPSETPPALGQRVAVRVVNNSARVIANPLPPEAEALLAAAGPMPVPRQGPPAAAPPPPVESYGYRQALGQGTLSALDH